MNSITPLRSFALATRGECDDDCCPADFDLNWRSDVEDLLVVLVNWS